MKIILLENFPKLGKKNEIVEVAEGYARNYLIPKKIGIYASINALRELDEILKKEKYEHDLLEQKAFEKCIKIETLGEITIKVSSQNGKMFGSVTSKDIAKELEKYNIEVDKKDIILEKPIKTFGNYQITIKLFEKLKANLNIAVAFE